MTRVRLRSGRLGFHLLTVLCVLVCLAAGRWQWERAYRTVADAVPDVPAVALADVDPRSTFPGMRIAVTGRFDPDHEVLVQPRPRDGVAGAWVLTPLLPDPASVADAPGGDTAVAVVRGWVPSGQPAGAPPSGVVSIEAVLVSDVREPGLQAQGDPPTLPVVDTGALAELTGYPIRSGWLALQTLQPTVSAQPTPLAVTDLPGADVGLNWRNAAYAVQWVIFAGFVVFFWSRFRRDLDQRPRQQEIIR